MTNGLRDAQAIEFFHLAFLQVLQARLKGGRYVLKGGANLRYFFASVRYSENIDLDITGIERWELEEKIDGILGSPVLSVLLRGGGLAVESFSKPKQTATTQRWKVTLALAGGAEPLRTKIEFSRRNGETRYLLEAVPARVVAPYALRSPSLHHYQTEAAAEQKVEALAGRSETQARDVFDLDLLLRPQPGLVAELSADVREQAANRALELPRTAFDDQVLPFLDPEVSELYVESDAWEQIRGFVVERLLEGTL
jgi:predicted nucleotidyltransferase component of viral defense system